MREGGEGGGKDVQLIHSVLLQSAADERGD